MSDAWWKSKHSRTGAPGAARLELSTLGRASRRLLGLERTRSKFLVGSSRKVADEGEKVGVVGLRVPRSDPDELADEGALTDASDTRRCVWLRLLLWVWSVRWGGWEWWMSGSEALRWGSDTHRTRWRSAGK